MVERVLPGSTPAPAREWPEQGQWTYEDWLRLPDDGYRYEVIDGVLYMTTAPSFFHQWIASRIIRMLQSQLEDKQRQLARVYGSYELNERLAAKIEAEIVELQKQMLANYHRMQVEMRTIVEKERFDVLRQRLERAIAPPPKELDAPRPVAPPK